jgi:small-conductance mechanosensitive channel
MVAGLLLLGALSISLGFYWYRKSVQLTCFTAPLAERLGEPDMSGKKHYTDCASHQWVMKNVVYGDYLKSGEGLRSFMMNRTMTGTMVIGIFLGLIPVIIVYLLFQSYQLIGTSLALVILSVYILRGPGELEISDKLAKWQIDQDNDSLTIGDLAYAQVSQRTIQSWIKKLVVIGAVCIILAPWGELILPAFAFVFTLFLGFIYENIYTPISLHSMPLALLVFFLAVPIVMSIGIILLKSIQRKAKGEDEGIRL